MPPVVKFAVTGEFVERVNRAMISGTVVSKPTIAAQPARVRSIISSTKQTESEMRSKFSAALQASAECVA